MYSPPDPPQAAASLIDRRTLAAAVKPFQAPCLRRSVWQLGSTLALFLAAQAALYWSLGVSMVLTAALVALAAGLTVRLFIIQHDCGHGAFFRARGWNDWIGRCCAVMTFTPYAFWRRQHANHHACFNNLDRRDTGIDLYSTCATVEEYWAMSPRRRLIYRLCRHPIITQFILPPLVFLLVYRVSFDSPRSWRKERRSVGLTNLALVGFYGGLSLLLGVSSVLLVQMPVISLAAIVGVWLFSVQHRFEESQWARQAEWNAVEASLEGSSYLKLPRVLQWFTGNIGFHHVHHLASRVPNYRLEECHASRPELGGVTTLTLRQALLAPCFALWDEERGYMVRFPSRRRAVVSGG